ncbi:hypothetical protein MOE46_17600, partial [Bacillus atrophaeus]
YPFLYSSFRALDSSTFLTFFIFKFHLISPFFKPKWPFGGQIVRLIFKEIQQKPPCFIREVK